MKKLRVCLSSELPALLERDKNYLYFTYDDLVLYAGQNPLNENFVISHEIPESQVNGLIYILDEDGSVHRKENYSDIQIAEIEDSIQIDLLKKAGTMFYVDAQHRYLDSQKRTLTLPFNNGVYELSVATKNNQKYDNDTILKYNTDTERFEVYGDTDEDFVDYSGEFRGSTTNTTKIDVNGPRISADVRISKSTGNILRVRADGLYIKPNSIVDANEFNDLKESVESIEDHAEDILVKIDNQLNELESIITKDYINEKIDDKLEEEYPTIDEALDNYQRISDSLEDMETETLAYADENINRTRTNLLNLITENTSWKDLDDGSSEYTHEVNYYKKAEEWYKPKLTTKQKLIIIFSAIAQYSADNKEKETFKIFMSAIASFMNNELNN